MKIFIQRFLLFILITCLPLHFVSRYMDAHPYDFCKDKLPWVFSHSNQTFDYIVGGSSRAENNFQIKLCDSILNQKGINIGYSGSGMPQIYLTLYEFLQHGNSTKRFILQLDPSSLIAYDTMKVVTLHSHYFLPYLNNPVVAEVIRMHKPALHYYLWKFIPGMKYAEFNNIYPITKPFTSKQDIHEVAFTLNSGTDLIHKGRSKSFMPDMVYHSRKFYLDDKPMDYFKRIVDLCKASHIELIVYTCPYYKKYIEKLDYSEFSNWMMNYASENSFAYLDYSVTSFSDSIDLFFNQTHLNAPGTALFTTQIADTLKRLSHNQNGTSLHNMN